MLTIRASRIPLALACPASLVDDGGPRVELGDQDAARLGTAVHAVLAGWLQQREPELQSIATIHSVEVEDLDRAVGFGKRAWAKLGKYFPTPRRVEWPMEFVDKRAGITLTGTTDVASVASGQVNVGDWKSGWGDADAQDQLKSYAFLAVQTTNVRQAWLATIHIRLQEADCQQLDRDDLAAWWERVKVRLKLSETYAPGLHCGYCPRALTCPARQAQARQMFAALFEHWPEEAILATDPSDRALQLAVALDAAKQGEKMAGEYRNFIKAEVIAAGGSMTTSDGRQLVIKEQEQRRIDYATGWPVLTASGLPVDELEEAVTVSKTKVETVVKNHAPYRGKGKAIEQLHSRLEAAGAFRVTTIHRLETKRVSTNAASITHDDAEPVAAD